MEYVNRQFGYIIEIKTEIDFKENNKVVFIFISIEGAKLDGWWKFSNQQSWN